MPPSMRAITRSLYKTMQKEAQDKNQKVSLNDLKLKVDGYISAEAYDKGLKLLDQMNQASHWIFCRRAEIQSRLGHKIEALKLVVDSLIFKRNGCDSCLKLVLKQINAKEIKEADQSLCGKYLEILNHLCDSNEVSSSFKTIYKKKRHLFYKKYQSTNNIDDNLLELLKEHHSVGTEMRKIEFIEVEKNFRVTVAQELIRTNEIILQIPEKKMITLETAKKHPAIKLLYQNQKKLRSPKHTLLAVLVLIETDLGEQSEYCTYFKCFPKQINNFPLKYSEQLLEELKATSFIDSLKSKKEDLVDDFRVVNKFVSFATQWTLQQFLWARMIVSSRIFGIVVNGLKTDALVPIADMLNHNSPKMTSWYYSDDRQSFIVKNMDDQILPGEEIYDSYGNKCNSRFLINYGFIQPSNNYNQVVVPFLGLNNNTFSTPCYRISALLMSDQLRCILSYYRKIIERKRLQCQSTKSSIITNINIPVGFISNENQLEVWKMIKKSMQKRISVYPTTIKADEKLLETDKDLSYNLKNCIAIRLGEKKVLEFFIKMSKIMIEHFSGKTKVSPLCIEYRPYLSQIGLSNT